MVAAIFGMAENVASTAKEHEAAIFKMAEERSEGSAARANENDALIFNMIKKHFAAVSDLKEIIEIKIDANTADGKDLNKVTGTLEESMTSKAATEAYLNTWMATTEADLTAQMA